MKILSRKRLYDMDAGGLAERIGGRAPVCLDVGTGSGKLVFIKAKSDPGGFYIGLDACAESMYENAVKAAKQEKKKALANLLFVVAPIEAPPRELAGIADGVSVILPWGSLRDGLVRAEPAIMKNLRMLGKPGAKLTVLVGYDRRLESREMVKRSLPELSRDYFAALSPAYRDAGILIRGIKPTGNGELKRIESEWAKKLAYGAAREMYRLDCVYI